ncbi:MAG: response regulator, partial [Candidatus Omnitrophica bacterium]|nr:response regulator [Candidatus Omnitrophota bacterium]
VICVPLHKAGKFTAAMAVHQTTPRHWTQEEIKLVGMVVARCWESLERSKTIRSLEQLTVDLEDRVTERTQQLEDQAKRLRQLAVELTQVEQKERRRLAEVLHDHLQQYLVAAKMRLGLLGRSTSDVDKKGLQEAESYIDQASQASRQLTAELRPPVLYEGGLGAGLRYLLQKMREQHKLEVHLSIEGQTEPGSDSIKVMIYQCVQELLFNIVKYAKVSECFVRVVRKENDDIQVTVEDYGTGFNVDEVAATQSGFGLFSIRERVKALAGELQIFSAPRQGSVFILNIPDKAIGSSISETTGVSGQAKRAMKDPSQEEGILILVADDHPIVRQSLANLLMAQSFVKEVLEAANGKEAVFKAETCNPDIILMDINMPVLNGIEATRILCSRNPHAKVIGLSVQAEDGIVQTMVDAGAVAHFNKGDDTETLLDAIRKFSLAKSN